MRLYRRTPESPDPLERMFELAPSGLLVLDGEGRIVRANRAAARIFDLGDPAGLLGRPVEPLFSDSFGQRLKEAFSNDEPGSEPGPLVVVARDVGGQEFPVEVTSGALSDGPSPLWGLAIRDLREHEALVQALTERAARLARSNQDLQQFANIASHDLQEPLRMINSYTQLILRRYPDRLDDSGREFLGFMVEGASRMQQLIDDLLTFARIESRGRSFGPVELEAVLAEAVRNLTVPIQETGARITHDPLTQIDGDDRQLVELFQNLLENAIKFRSTTPPRIHVSEALDGSVLVLSIRDDGLGVAPEYHERIFQIFQRLHLPEEYPGTGIGLAVCKRVVERHGGRIWVESQGVPGEGSTFFVSLPRHHVIPPPSAPAEPASEGERRAIEIAQDLIERRLRQLA